PAQVLSYFGVQRLIDRREDAALQQECDHILRLDAELFGELLHGRAFDQAHGFKLGDSRAACAAANRAGDALFERERLRRRNVIAVEAAALAAKAFAHGGRCCAATTRAGRAPPRICGRRVERLRCRALAGRAGELDRLARSTATTALTAATFFTAAPLTFARRRRSRFGRRRALAGTYACIERGGCGPEHSDLFRGRRWRWLRLRLRPCCRRDRHKRRFACLFDERRGRRRRRFDGA